MRPTLPAVNPLSSSRRLGGLALCFTLLAITVAPLVVASPVAAAPVYDGPSEVNHPVEEDGESFYWYASLYLSDSELDDSAGSIFCSEPLAFGYSKVVWRVPGECRYWFQEDDFCEITVAFVAYSSGGFTPFEVRFNGSSYCQQFAPGELDTLQAETFLASLVPGLDQSSSQRSPLVVPLLVALAVLAISAAAYLLRQQVSRRAS